MHAERQRETTSDVILVWVSLSRLYLVINSRFQHVVREGGERERAREEFKVKIIHFLKYT